MDEVNEWDCVAQSWEWIHQNMITTTTSGHFTRLMLATKNLLIRLMG